MSNPIAVVDAATEDVRAELADALTRIQELEGHVAALRILVSVMAPCAQCSGVAR